MSAQTESLFATGNQIGDIAQQLYGTDKSVEVAFNFKTMVAETARLIDGGADFPIFEGTFRHEGVLIRADVLIPDGNGWRLIEVKASTSVKDYHVLDCAIQDWVLRNAGINVTSISLAHVNNQFVYQGDGNYDGLLLENELTEEVRALEPRVIELLAKARTAVTGPMPEIIVGAQCNKPYECQFQAYCWPTDTRYPITGLGGSKANLGKLVALGVQDILDVDENSITSETQQRIFRVTCKGEAEVLDRASVSVGVRGILKVLRYLKMLPASTKRSEQGKTPTVIAKRSTWVRAPRGGILTPCLELGKAVNPDSILGTVGDPFGVEETEVIAGVEGIVIGRTKQAVVDEGDGLFHVAYSRNPEGAEEKINRNERELDESFDRSVFDEPE